jgi:cobalamin synthase
VVRYSKIPARRFTKIILIPVFAGLVMGLIAWGLHWALEGLISYNLATVISILIAAVVYFIIILATKMISKEDLHFIKA